jgi:hypothetical protein
LAIRGIPNPHDVDLALELEGISPALERLLNVPVKIRFNARMVKILDHDLDLVRHHIYIDEAHLWDTEETTLAGSY